MPSIYTHHLFGLEVLERIDLAELTGSTANEAPAVRNAFLYGNQGPDPLYLQQAIPHSTSKQGVLAGRMHDERTNEVLVSMQHACSNTPTKRAYGLGFLCHYLLDRAVHPLVYAETYALCDAGVEGLSRETAKSQVHAEIETQLDQMMLTRRLGATCEQYPLSDILRPTRAVAHEVSPAFAYTLKQAFDVVVSDSLFETCSTLYRVGLLALVSKSGIKRHFIGEVEATFRHYSYLRAVTHQPKETPETPWSNDNHFPWPNPWGDGVICASFDEFYGRALNDTLAAIPLWASVGQTLESAALWTHNVNFRGESLA